MTRTLTSEVDIRREGEGSMMGLPNQGMFGPDISDSSSPSSTLWLSEMNPLLKILNMHNIYSVVGSTDHPHEILFNRLPLSLQTHITSKQGPSNRVKQSTSYKMRSIQ